MSQITALQAEKRSRKFAPFVFGLVLVAVVALIFLLLYGLQLRSAPPLASGYAPEFSITTFDGQTLSSASLKGKAVVVNFWASWCIPCRDEAPALERAWEKYGGRGLVVLGVDYVDTEPEAKAFISEFKQTYPNGPDVGTRVSQAYHITGVPETYFIGRDGKLLPGIDSDGHVNGNWIGPVPEEALIARIEQLLAE
jgi:cytochrome c biogenesis protein CcmG, thiol:disulfide interchange protein DsbE